MRSPIRLLGQLGGHTLPTPLVPPRKIPTGGVYGLYCILFLAAAWNSALFGFKNPGLPLASFVVTARKVAAINKPVIS
jgi:hypothetical protein